MLTTKQAQAILGINLRHFYDLVSRGEIAHYRYGRIYRFEEAEIQAYKESCAVAARVPKPISIIRGEALLPGAKSAAQLELQQFFKEYKVKKKEKT